MPNIPTKRERRRLLRDDYSTQQNGNGNPTLAYRNKIFGKQVTVSEGHPWTNKGYKGEDVGGDFYTIQRKFRDTRNRVSDPQPQFAFSDKANGYHYYGPLYPVPTSVTYEVDPKEPWVGQLSFPESLWPADPSSSKEEMDAIGATAIARCKPTTSPASLSTAFGELVKEGLPSLIGTQTWKNRSDGFRNLGGEYLNVQFGWLPLVSEIKATAETLVKADKLLKQYEKDAGKLVRRAYDFPVERSTEITEYPSWHPWATDLFKVYGTLENGFSGKLGGGSIGSLTLEREVVRKRWFRGAFTYHLPTGYHSRDAVGKATFFATHFLGLELTPEVLWNLAPWSWAADWVGNVGDVLSNVSDMASDGLVLRYGYVMEHTIVKHTYTNTGFNLLGYGRRPITASFITETKQRRRATPFGFGLDDSAFSARQLAILAALGISRAPR